MFRPPRNPSLFATLVATGFQYSVAIMAFLIVASFGMQLGAHMREYLLLLGVLLTAVTGSLRGYFAARLFKLLKGKHWKVLAIKLCLITLLGMLLLMIVIVADHAEPDRF